MSVAPQITAGEVLFDASRRIAALDHFGVPYRVSDAAHVAGGAVEWLRPVGDGPALLWPASSRRSAAAPVVASLQRPGEPEIPVFGGVTGDDTAATLLTEHGGDWSRTELAVNVDDECVASVWRAEDGSMFLPFDPDEVHFNYLSEGYHEIADRAGGRAWHRYAMRAYYAGRGLLPRPAQIWLRRRYAVVQARSVFPRWPVETGLHDFLEFVFQSVQSLVDEPVPRLASWPGDAWWALVLTHDVETGAGLAALDPVLDLERGLGLMSAWNFVPRRDFEVSERRVKALQRDGFEVGVHGLHHDGRDLESRAVLDKRLPGMRAAADRWNAVGFRSPSTRRDWKLMPLLGFDYDSSYPDTDPFEPQSGGCCTWLPFFNRGLVELPLTMPQDHTLFTILRQEDERLWLEKGEFLRDRGGMVLLDTHPDYLVEKKVFDSYASVLRHFADDPHVWTALPSEVSDWWRRRARSKLLRTGSEWRVVGPAAGEAEIEYASMLRREPVAATGD